MPTILRWSKSDLGGLADSACPVAAAVAGSSCSSVAGEERFRTDRPRIPARCPPPGWADRSCSVLERTANLRDQGAARGRELGRLRAIQDKLLELRRARADSGKSECAPATREAVRNSSDL